MAVPLELAEHSDLKHLAFFAPGRILDLCPTEITQSFKTRNFLHVRILHAIFRGVDAGDDSPSSCLGYMAVPLEHATLSEMKLLLIDQNGRFLLGTKIAQSFKTRHFLLDDRVDEWARHSNAQRSNECSRVPNQTPT